MDLITKVKKTVADHHLLKVGDRVLVGVSGGADSVSLIYILSALRHDFGISLQVAHLNHGLRKGAQKDQEFVARLSRKLNLPFMTATVDIPQKARRESLEEIAREARFDFLIKSVRKHKATAIALGHTQDDLAETVLMRIFRGTGLSGMRGILPARSIHGIRFIRPLLETSRREIELFLAKNNIGFRNDPSNRYLHFFRNKVRLKVLPFLEKEVRRDIKKILAYLSQTAALDYDYLQTQGKKILDELAPHQNNKQILCIKLDGFVEIHPAMQRILLRLAIERLKGDTRRLTLRHIQILENLACQKAAGVTVHLPGLTVTKGQRQLILTLRNS